MDMTKFKTLLDEQMNWPEYYTFKFVVKAEHKDHALDLLVEHTVQERDSKTGKFTSITSRKLVHSSQDVVAVYTMMKKVEGIMSL
jgi:putative lipoic acid-binding regulatory protein